MICRRLRRDDSQGYRGSSLTHRVYARPAIDLEHVSPLDGNHPLTSQLTMYGYECCLHRCDLCCARGTCTVFCKATARKSPQPGRSIKVVVNVIRGGVTHKHSSLISQAPRARLRGESELSRTAEIDGNVDRLCFPPRLRVIEVTQGQPGVV